MTKRLAAGSAWLLLMVCMSMSALADVPEDLTEPAPAYFVFVYEPGPNWLEGKPIFEQPTEPHIQYMNARRDDGTLVLGGPYKDSSGAMGIFQAGSLEQATELVENDPWVRDGIVTYRLAPWHPSFPGQVESRPW